MRVTWDDGSNLQLLFYAKPERRSFVAVQHGKLASRAEAGRMRAFWTERLQVLGVHFASAETATHATRGKSKSR